MKCMRPTEGAASCPYCGFAGEETYQLNVLRPGTILRNQYLLGKPLGQGGFGITYIARDLNLDMRVAVKEYYPNGYAIRNVENSDRVTITDERLRMDIQKGRDSFLKEARTLAGFKGTPGIVDVLSCFEANGTAYIVMEYLEGETLGHRLKRELFSADEIFELIDPILNTLETIHRQKVIHRDISPDNVMMLPDGRLKLMDFGAARLMNYDNQLSMSVVLKAGYAPLEQYSAKGEQGPWTDIYALCATIYKCITGITPEVIIDRMTEDKLKWPSEMGFHISVRQEAVLKKGMAVFQNNRFQSIAELREALKENGDDIGSNLIEDWPIDEDVTVVLKDTHQKNVRNSSFDIIEKEEKRSNRTEEQIKQTDSFHKMQTGPTKKKNNILLWIACSVFGLATIALAVLFVIKGGRQDNSEKEMDADQAAATIEQLSTSAPTEYVREASSVSTSAPTEYMQEASSVSTSAPTEYKQEASSVSASDNLSTPMISVSPALTNTSVSGSIGEATPVPTQTVDESMHSPISLAEGVYQAVFKTNGSSFLPQEGRCLLEVKKGKMLLRINLVNENVENLFQGLKEDAQKAGAALINPTMVVSQGGGALYGFTMPLKAIDEEFDLAFLASNGQWYDRKIIVTDPRVVIDRRQNESADELEDDPAKSNEEESSFEDDPFSETTPEDPSGDNPDESEEEQFSEDGYAEDYPDESEEEQFSEDGYAENYPDESEEEQFSEDGYAEDY
jgi:serine/threonine protein kinase